jgi:hypothetical protein
MEGFIEFGNGISCLMFDLLTETIFSENSTLISAGILMGNFPIRDIKLILLPNVA